MRWKCIVEGCGLARTGMSCTRLCEEHDKATWIVFRVHEQACVAPRSRKLSKPVVGGWFCGRCRETICATERQRELWAAFFQSHRIWCNSGVQGVLMANGVWHEACGTVVTPASEPGWLEFLAHRNTCQGKHREQCAWDLPGGWNLPGGWQCSKCLGQIRTIPVSEVRRRAGIPSLEVMA